MSITTPILIPIPFCNSGNKATIPVNPPTIPDEANYASYETGFPPVTMIPIEANGIPPRGRDLNGILYVLSSNIQNWNAGVQMKFNSDFCTTIGGYPLGSVLQSNDGKTAYVSTIENNTGDFNANPELIGTDWILYGGGGSGDSIRFVVAEGSSDIITATYANPVTELTDGMIVCFQATAANVTTTPSFNPNGIGAVTIVKGTNQPLNEGDIGGAGYLAILQYSATWNKWVLQNPATGIISASGAPIGSGLIHYGSTAPQHYLVCDGAALSRTAYPELFTAIGTIYGEGDGSTTFNLPNMLDRFPQGKNTGFQGIYINPGLPNITGWVGFMGGGGVREVGGAFYTGDGGVSYVHNTATISVNVAGFSALRSNPIYGSSDTVQPAALTILPCIKYE